MRAGRPRSQVTFIAAWCAMRMTVSREHKLLEQGCGETGFPHAPADAGRRPAHPGPGPWEGLGGLRPPRKYVHPVGVRREPHGRLKTRRSQNHRRCGTQTPCMTNAPAEQGRFAGCGVAGSVRPSGPHQRRRPYAYYHSWASPPLRLDGLLDC